MGDKEAHYKTLMHISRDLTLVGENKKDISRLLIEPEWIKQGDPLRMPDLIGLSYSDWAVIIELKHSIRKRSHAIDQVMNGERYVFENFEGIFVCRKKIAYYNEDRIEWECID